MKNEFAEHLKFKERDIDKKRGKRRFQERIAEEREAEKDIKNFKEQDALEQRDNILDNDERPTIPQ